MKKTIMITALLISSISISFAQSSPNVNARDLIHVGAKAGLNFANVYDTKGEEFDANAKVGFAFGGYLTIPIGLNYGIQPEVLFSQKGFTATGKSLGTNYDFKRTTTYLDIPLYFAVKPTEFITLLAGPQFSYLLSKKDVFAIASTTIAQEQEFQNENYRKNTLGFSMGVDVNINHLVFGIRANWDLQENNGDGTSSTPRYKNQWMQTTIGYRL